MINVYIGYPYWLVDYGYFLIWRLVHALLNGQIEWATWSAAAAGFVTACVIYKQLKDSREVAFLDEAHSDEFHRDRIKLYHSFLGEGFDGGVANRQGLWHLGQKFDKKVVQGTQLESLRQRQNTHLCKVACLYGKRRFRWYWQTIERCFPDSVVEWFPSAVVACWIILEPYILKRASSIGAHWSAPLVNYTLACLNLILDDEDAQILIYRKEGEELIVSREVLSEIRSELETICRFKSRGEMKSYLEKLNRRNGWPKDATF